MLIIDLLKLIESATKNPTEADFLDLLRQLDQSIESSSQLPAAGDAIEQLAAIYNDRANAKFDEIEWLKSPQNEPIISLSEFDRYVRQSCVVDIDRFMLDREHYYPENRADAISVDRMMAEVLESIIEDEQPIDVAHDEDVKAWVNETLDRVNGKPRSLSSLSRGKSIVQIWLSILLSEGKLTASRTKGDFYDRKGIIITTPTSTNFHESFNK
jgi:hypothetical protein